MVEKKIPVIAAIPAYNAAKTIRPLLNELIAQGYDDIYVLDDASTDSTVKIVKQYSPAVKLIEGEENVGSGANRNRIIGQTPKAIIHFIDADMKLLSKDTPRIIRRLDWPIYAAYIGGLVRNPDGSQNPFNFGPRPGFITSVLRGAIQFACWRCEQNGRQTA
jgi:N-acetylglucosaminyl-diphospho-decaprenol L-rhamnosyltransferase